MSEFQSQINRNKIHGAGMRQWLHYFRWKRSLQSGATSMRDRIPWITFDAIDVLRSNLNKQSRVFEFGGGGSTLFFLDHAREVVTAEHNCDWFDALKAALSESEKKRWTGILHQAEEGKITESLDASVPEHYYTDDENYRYYHFRSYVCSVDQFADESFDVVLVDGRSRPACLIHALLKVKVGGLLVLDNSDREYYLEKTMQRIQEKYVPIITNQGASPYAVEFSRTTIWRRIRK